jgi:hypothetical protein
MMASSIRRHGPEPIVISMSVSPTSRFIDCVRHTRDIFLFDLMYERSRVSMFRHHFSQMLRPAPRSVSTATIRNWGVVRCSRSHSAAPEQYARVSPASSGCTLRKYSVLRGSLRDMSVLALPPGCPRPSCNSRDCGRQFGGIKRLGNVRLEPGSKNASPIFGACKARERDRW